MIGPALTRDVDTELLYWSKPVPGNAITCDFTGPRAAELMKEHTKANKPFPVKIHDIRSRADEYTLFENGFQYVHHEVPELSNATTEEEIERVLVPATEQLVRKMTGATKILIYCTRIRSKATDAKTLHSNQSPAFETHSDLIVPGALQTLGEFVPDKEERDDLLANYRFIAINVWRPLQTITRDPFAVLDWKSCSFKRDWISRKLILQKPGMKWWTYMGLIRHHDEHRWFYLSHQTPSEPVVFSQTDTDTDAVEAGGRCVAHSAFVDPEYANAPPRASIEIKLFSFVPK